MKPILSVMREKNRYVYFISYCDNFESFRKEFFSSFRELFGAVLFSNAGMSFVSYSYKENKIFGIVKVKQEYLKFVLASFSVMKFPTHSMFVSGSIKKLKKKISY